MSRRSSRGGAEGERFLRQLAHRIRAGRLELRVFADRMVFSLVDERRSRHDDACRRRVACDRCEQVMRAAHVHREGRAEAIPRAARLRVTRQVIHEIGRRLDDRAIDAAGVQHVNGMPGAWCALRLVMAAAVRPGDQTRVGRGEKIEEMAAGKARRARHEDRLRHGRLALQMTVLRLVVGAVLGVLLLDRAPPPIVVRGTTSTVSASPSSNAHRRRPSQLAQLRRVERIAAIVAGPIGHRPNQRCRALGQRRGCGSRDRCS